MAGRPKQGIDYAGWSVDLFENDTKIDKLLDAQGWTGFSIYFYLCMRAFGSDGYFYRWGYDDCASTARKMGGGIRSGTVSETVGYCLQIGLFDKRLFDEWGVLTSRGIQRSYWAVLKARRSRQAYRELWLLDSTECEGLFLVPLFKSPQTAESHLHHADGDLQARDESVVKDSIVKDKKTMCRAEASALFEKLWQQYPSKKGKGKVSDSQKARLLKIGHDEMSRAIERYVDGLKKDPWRKPQNGSTFFNSGYIDYLDENYNPEERRITGGSRKNPFNNFQQNEYDFDQLERELTANGGG